MRESAVAAEWLSLGGGSDEVGFGAYRSVGEPECESDCGGGRRE